MPTPEEIWTVADALAAEGQKPTLAAVRHAVGGGSFTTISEAMSAWRARQATVAEQTRTAIPVPEAVQRLADTLATQIWAEALRVAEGRLQADREALEQTRQTLTQEKTEAVDMADALALELDQLRETLKAQLICQDENETAIQDLSMEVDQWRREAGALREQSAHLQGHIRGLEQALLQLGRGRGTGGAGGAEEVEGAEKTPEPAPEHPKPTPRAQKAGRSR